MFFNIKNKCIKLLGGCNKNVNSDIYFMLSNGYQNKYK